MTTFRLNFCGHIKKAETRNAGGKPIVELSLCRKNRTRQGEADAYTWVRVTVWEPADFQADKLVKGSFVAGSGEMAARSYDGKDGKAVAIEVSCRSFDIEVVEVPTEDADQRKANAMGREVIGRDGLWRDPRPAPAAADDEPPF